MVRSFCAGDSRRCAEIELMDGGAGKMRRALVETRYELLIRMGRARNAGVWVLLKYPLWVVMRLVGRR